MGGLCRGEDKPSEAVGERGGVCGQGECVCVCVSDE